MTHGSVRPRRWGSFRARLDRFMRHPVTDAVVMVLIVVSVALFAVEVYRLVSGPLMRAVELTGEVITALFVVELSARWYTAPSTRRHFREYWLDWLAVLPVLRPFRVLRILRILRLLRLYRFGALAQRFVADTEHHRFEAMLRNEISHYRGRFAEQVWLVPDLFRMMSNLLEDGRVDAESRRLIATSLAYFVTPFELFPRELHGAEGYLDQVYLCLWSVLRLQDELPEHVLEDAWEGEGAILEIAEAELPALEEALGDEGLERLQRYLGLQRLARRYDTSGPSDRDREVRLSY